MSTDADRLVAAPETIKQPLDQLQALLTQKDAEIARLMQEQDEAHEYLARLFHGCAPLCIVEDDVLGVATQIDNYIAGLHQRVDAAEASLASLTSQVGSIVQEMRGKIQQWMSEATSGRESLMFVQPEAYQAQAATVLALERCSRELKATADKLESLCRTNVK